MGYLRESERPEVDDEDERLIECGDQWIALAGCRALRASPGLLATAGGFARPTSEDRQARLDRVAVLAAVATLVVGESGRDLLHPVV